MKPPQKEPEVPRAARSTYRGSFSIPQRKEVFMNSHKPQRGTDESSVVFFTKFALFRHPINVMDRFVHRYSTDSIKRPLMYYIDRVRRVHASKRRLRIPRLVFLVK